MIETKYKDTEVGRIPVDWNIIAIKELVEDMADGPFGSNLKTEHYTLDKQVRIIQLGNIGDCGWMDDNTKYTTFEHAKTLQRCIAQPGCILIAKMMPAGRAVICPSKEMQYILGSDVVRISPKDILNATYFVYQSKSEIYKAQIAANTQGSTRQRTSISKLRDILIPLPPTKLEQERIAKALSNIDALISQLDKLIEKKRAIKQGAMQQLLTCKKRLKGFSEPWVEKKLGEDATILRGSSPRPIEDYITDSQDGLNWIKIGDVKPEEKYLRKTAEKIKKEGLSKTRQVKKGDFILSNSMSFGRPYILDIDGCIHDGWLVIQDYQEAYDMQLLYYILCSDAIMDQYVSMAAGSSVQNLNKEKVANVLLYAPTSLQEQSAIASILTSMDDEITALEAKKVKCEQIKQGMMQQLLTGKIRLVETAVKTNATFANVHFRRSVLAAEIADRLCEEPTFGHVKMEKMLFLTERLCRIDIGSHYHRDAAGPYDNRALRSIDSQLKKQKWFEVRRTEKGNRYVPMQNRGKHKTYFDKYFSAVLPTFEKIIDTFKTQNTERCEIVATLYSAWEDFLNSNKTFTDADIVNEVLNNWHESKKRISRERWLNAIQWMRENGFVPNDRNG